MKEDSIYRMTVEKMRDVGARIIEFTPPQVPMNGFLNILNMDMRNDLPDYLQTRIKK